MPMALEGIRVLDWTAGQQGPVATTMLADLGADVIKIEDPHGDIGRDLLPGRGGLPGNRNYYFEGNNRNKRGIVLDLKKDEAREVLYRLVEKSDVFVQNWRKGVAARLGVDYKTLSRYNPKLIYASASAFGPEGPDSEKPGFDIMGMARSGLMLSVGHPDWPPVFPRSMADQIGAMMLALTILAALVVRERSGIGQEVDTSLLGSMIFAQGGNITSYLMQRQEFGRRDRKDAVNPFVNYYKCADDKWLVLAMSRHGRYWHDFCQVMGIQDMEKDPRFDSVEKRNQDHKRELIAALDQVFATRPRVEWLEKLSQNEDFLYSYVNTVPDLESDPQVVANDYIIEIDHPVLGKVKEVGLPARFSKTPPAIRREAPALGEHTEEVLREVLGYGADEIGRLKKSGAIVPNRER